jgi:hypothetical protein
MTSRHPAKKPSGGRPNVRKLFSKDSFSSLASIAKHDRSDSSADESVGPSASSSRKATQNLGNAGLGTIQEKEKAPWLGNGFVSPPMPDKGGDRSVVEGREGGQISLDERNVRLVETKPTLPPGSPSTVPFVAQHKALAELEQEELAAELFQPPPSPSKVRWNSLRQHILPPSSVTSSPNPSFTSFSQLNLNAPIPVPQPVGQPRPSRLANRFGFRQVVAETRLAAEDTSRRFADEIQRACWEVRASENKPIKPEREPSQPSTLGSTLHLPFISSASLPIAGNASNPNLSATTLKGGLRGIPSTTSLAPGAGLRLQALTTLHGIIMRYAAVQDSVIEKTLPHEGEVLSVLLAAFLRDNSDPVTEDERRLSLQLFEMISTTWKPPLEVGI